MNDEQIKNLILSLQALKPKESLPHAEAFSKVFRAVLAQFKAGVSQNEILSTLKNGGLDLSAAVFRKLMAVECEAHDIKIDKSKKGAARYRT